MFFCFGKRKKRSKQKKKQVTTAIGKEHGDNSEMQILETKVDNQFEDAIRNDSGTLQQNTQVDYRNSKSISINLKSVYGKSLEIPPEMLKNLTKRKKMKKIDGEVIRTMFIKMGIEAEFVNFNSRKLEVKVKQESFKYINQYFREFDNKLIEKQDFRIVVLEDFFKRFKAQNYSDKEWVRNLNMCKHDNECEHVVYDIVSFLEAPTSEDLEEEAEIKREEMKMMGIGIEEQSKKGKDQKKRKNSKKENTKNTKREEEVAEVKEQKAEMKLENGDEIKKGKLLIRH